MVIRGLCELWQYLESFTEEESSNMEFGTYGTHERPLTSVFLGTKFLAKYMYQLSPVEVRLNQNTFFFVVKTNFMNIFIYLFILFFD